MTASKETYTRDDCQFHATTLSGIIEGIDILINEADIGTSDHAEAVVALLRVARLQSAELARMLDSVHAPKTETRSAAVVEASGQEAA